MSDETLPLIASTPAKPIDRVEKIFQLGEQLQASLAKHPRTNFCLKAINSAVLLGACWQTYFGASQICKTAFGKDEITAVFDQILGFGAGAAVWGIFLQSQTLDATLISTLKNHFIVCVIFALGNIMASAALTLKYTPAGWQTYVWTACTAYANLFFGLSSTDSGMQVMLDLKSKWPRIDKGKFLFTLLIIIIFVGASLIGYIVPVAQLSASFVNNNSARWALAVTMGAFCNIAELCFQIAAMLNIEVDYSTKRLLRYFHNPVPRGMTNNMLAAIISILITLVSIISQAYYSYDSLEPYTDETNNNILDKLTLVIGGTALVSPFCNTLGAVHQQIVEPVINKISSCGCCTKTAEILKYWFGGNRSGYVTLENT
jgi:hypothetical protein